MEKKGYVLAPRNTISNKIPISYMYREEPDNIYDSGWRVFGGNETDDYVNNPDNIGIFDIATIESIYPELSSLFTLPVGTVLERRSGADKFSSI